MNKRKFCQICNKTYTALGEHVKRTHKIDLKDYYDQYIREDGEGFCKVCGKETKWCGSIAHGYRFYRQKTRRACPLDEYRYFLMQLNIA